MDEPRLGNRLKVARAERNLSQRQLARQAGETRQYCPSALLAFVLSERLGVRVDELFFLEGDGE